MKTLELPKWLEENASVSLPASRGCLWRIDYLEKTLQQIEKVVAAEAKTASNRQHTFLFKLEPHVKLGGMLALVLAAAVTKQLLFLTALTILLPLMAVFQGLGLKSYAMRVWLPAFIFTGLSVLPAVLSWVTPGENVITLYSGLNLQIGVFTLPVELYITKQGIQSALFVMLRSASSLGLAALLITTTRWSQITKTLRGFRLPPSVVAVLDLTYRYIYLFLLLFMDFIMGRKSRLVGREAYKAKLTFIGSAIAGFLRLIAEYSTDINHAMLSRGYRGQYYREQTLKIRQPEFIFLLVVAVLCYFA